MKKLFALIIILFTGTAHAYFQQDFMAAKRMNKQMDRWTISDWLQQKKRIQLMDQWLAMHTSSNIFELNFSGAAMKYKMAVDTGTPPIVTTDESSSHYQMDLYLTLFNINGEFQKFTERKEAYGGGAGIRLLGTSSQTTSLTARYGWRKLNDFTTREHWENYYAEGVLQLYIAEELGLSGEYRQYMPASSNLGTRLEGTRTLGGPFLEFSIMRLFANYYQEPLKLTVNGSVTKITNTGYEAGLKLFF